MRAIALDEFADPHFWYFKYLLRCALAWSSRSPHGLSVSVLWPLCLCEGVINLTGLLLSYTWVLNSVPGLLVLVLPPWSLATPAPSPKEHSVVLEQSMRLAWQKWHPSGTWLVGFRSNWVLLLPLLVSPDLDLYFVDTGGRVSTTPHALPDTIATIHVAVRVWWVAA